jgi:hypothetical protein
LPANRIHISANLDIGVMHLNLPLRARDNSPIRMPAMKLGPAFPQVGSLCFATGYHAMRCNVAVDGRHTHEISQSYSGTRGRITQIYFPRRDTAFLNFPCFETTSRFDPGMSGAPIITEGRSVVGAVCSSFGETSDGHISYGSLVGPALFLEIDTPNGKAFLYDFVSGGSVVCDETFTHLSARREEQRLSIDFGVPPVFEGHLRPRGA